MIQPIITANQAIANKTTLKSQKANSSSPYFAGAIKEAYLTDRSVKGEKLDVKSTGCREYSLNGNKVDYFA